MTPTASDRPITVLVAEDEPDARLLIVYQLDLEEDISVVATAGDGVEAVELCAEHNPDVVVADLLMPRMNGIEAIGLIRERHPHVGLVAVTAVAGEVVRTRMGDLDVELVLKSGDPERLLAAVRRAAARGPTEKG